MNTLTASLVLETIAGDHVFKNDISGALAYGIPKSLFGFATVFAVLILIWGILALFKVFFYTIPEAKKKGAKKPVQKADANEKPSAPVQTAPAVQAQSGNDTEIAAVIMAAIEAYRASEGVSAPGGFRVVSFKKRI